MSYSPAFQDTSSATKLGQSAKFNYPQWFIKLPEELKNKVQNAFSFAKNRAADFASWISRMSSVELYNILNSKVEKNRNKTTKTSKLNLSNVKPTPVIVNTDFVADITEEPIKTAPLKLNWRDELEKNNKTGLSGVTLFRSTPLPVRKADLSKSKTEVVAPEETEIKDSQDNSGNIGLTDAPIPPYGDDSSQISLIQANEPLEIPVAQSQKFAPISDKVNSQENRFGRKFWGGVLGTAITMFSGFMPMSGLTANTKAVHTYQVGTPIEVIAKDLKNATGNTPVTVGNKTVIAHLDNVEGVGNVNILQKDLESQINEMDKPNPLVEFFTGERAEAQEIATAQKTSKIALPNDPIITQALDAGVTPDQIIQGANNNIALLKKNNDVSQVAVSEYGSQTKNSAQTAIPVNTTPNLSVIPNNLNSQTVRLAQTTQIATQPQNVLAQNNNPEVSNIPDLSNLNYLGRSTIKKLVEQNVPQDKIFEIIKNSQKFFEPDLTPEYLGRLNKRGLEIFKNLTSEGKSPNQIKLALDSDSSLQLSKDERAAKYNQSSIDRLERSQNKYQNIFGLTVNDQVLQTANKTIHLTGNISSDPVNGLNGGFSSFYADPNDQRTVNFVNTDGRGETIFTSSAIGATLTTGIGVVNTTESKVLRLRDYTVISVLGFIPLSDELLALIPKNQTSSTETRPDDTIFATTTEELKVNTQFSFFISSLQNNNFTTIPSIQNNDLNKTVLRSFIGNPSAFYIKPDGNIGVTESIFNYENGATLSGIVQNGAPGLVKIGNLDPDSLALVTGKISDKKDLLSKLLGSRIEIDGKTTFLGAAAQNFSSKRGSDVFAKISTNSSQSKGILLTILFPSQVTRITFPKNGEDQIANITVNNTTPTFNLNLGLQGSEANLLNQNIVGAFALAVAPFNGAENREEQARQLEIQRKAGRTQTIPAGFPDAKGGIETRDTLLGYNNFNTASENLNRLTATQTQIKNVSGSFSPNGSDLTAFFVGNDTRTIWGSQTDINQAFSAFYLRDFNFYGIANSPSNLTLNTTVNGQKVQADTRTALAGVGFIDIGELSLFNVRSKTVQLPVYLPTVGFAVVTTRDNNQDGLSDLTFGVNAKATFNLNSGNVPGLSNPQNKIGTEGVILSADAYLALNLGRQIEGGRVVSSTDLNARLGFNTAPTIFSPNGGEVVLSDYRKLGSDVALTSYLGVAYKSPTQDQSTVSVNGGVNALLGTVRVGLDVNTNRGWKVTAGIPLSETVDLSAFYQNYSFFADQNQPGVYNQNSTYGLGINAGSFNLYGGTSGGNLFAGGKVELKF